MRSIILIFIFFAATTQAQDRSQLSLMVMPDTSGVASILSKVETDNAYKSAITEVNNALINSGYKNTLDFKTNEERIARNRDPTKEESKSDWIRLCIEAAPVDVFIETSIHWLGTGDSPDRQVQLSLKAVDKYTSAVYADAVLSSQRREFPSLEKAVSNTLKIDAQEAFEQFLKQLDYSYNKVLKEGRQANMQFEIDKASKVLITDRVNNRRISDRIEEYVEKKAFKGQYKIIGEGPAYMDIVVQVPVIDDKGNAVTPSRFLGRGMDDYFYEMGFNIKYVSSGRLMKFVLKEK
ncbi:hypothetical protein SAMN05518672_104779 [Chitinophaga sp. CF118]|uniref:DUF6175 family protein n=1 Tax=Chitinophaga sp. CF118 TaxID=1884367 RepID=UPI0008E429DE|nr:DUF6175 family protein [Chitinophaga sp. CF118]SFE17900.1 hypothetical protein SAMN05518672_104779 [Chitinophaga sp. CF118]